MITAFLTGISNEFDVELAKVLSENGYKTYAGYSGMGDAVRTFAELVEFNPDNSESIDKACGELLKNPGHIDLYIDTANYKLPEDDFNVSGNVDYDIIEEIYTANVLRPIALYEGFMPLIKRGSLKRCCFLTSSKASVNSCTDILGYGYNMSKAGLYNFLQIIKNKLSPEGFTFRIFDPSFGELTDEAASKSAYNYFTRRRGVEGGRDDESRLVIRNAFGEQQSW